MLASSTNINLTGEQKMWLTTYTVLYSRRPFTHYLYQFKETTDCLDSILRRWKIDLITTTEYRVENLTQGEDAWVLEVCLCLHVYVFQCYKNQEKLKEVEWLVMWSRCLSDLAWSLSSSMSFSAEGVFILPLLVLIKTICVLIIS